MTTGLVVLSNPLYVFKNANYARIDIINVGHNTKNTIDIKTNIPKAKISKPDWFNKKTDKLSSNSSSQGVVIEIPITKKWTRKHIEFINRGGEGTTTLTFSGQYDYHQQNYTDYKNIVINGHVIHEKQITTSNTNNFSVNKTVKNDERTVIEFDTKIHRPRIIVFNFAAVILFALIFSMSLVYRKYANNIFLLSMAIVLMIPASNINNSDKSEQENRTLTTKPQLITNTQEINLKYGEQYDQWFSDRFFGREFIISKYNSFKFLINTIHKTDKAVFDKTNNQYFSFPIHHKIYFKEQVINNIKKLDEWCNQNGIKLYVLLIPDKAPIYSDISKRYGYNHKTFIKKYEQIREIASTLSDGRFVYPYKELMDAKKDDLVFFKADYHWTDWGAYNGYQALINVIKKDFPEIKVVPIEDYKQTSNNLIRSNLEGQYMIPHYAMRILNIPYKYAETDLLSTPHTYYDYKTPDVIDIDIGNYAKICFNKTKTVPQKRVMLIGDSQNGNLSRFLPYSFKALKFIQVNKEQLSLEEEFKIIKHYDSEILEFNPDIMIISILENHLDRLNDLLKE